MIMSMSEIAYRHPNLKNNGRKKLLFLGETGNGKSALCNAFSQPVQTDGGNLQQNFPESANQAIGNTKTILKNIDFLGLIEMEISVIDTVGFNSTQINNTAVAELIVKLKEYCDYIHTFAIVISSPKRIEASLIETIKLFVGMFGGERFWKNAVLIFTNLQQSDSQIRRRSRNNSDEKLIRDFNAMIRKEFSLQRDIPTLIIDAHYDGSKDDERERFINSARKLYDMLITSEGTNVNNVQSVVGKYEGLQEEVEHLTIEIAKRKVEAQLLERAKKQAEEKKIQERKAKINAQRLAQEYQAQAEFLARQRQLEEQAIKKAELDLIESQRQAQINAQRQEDARRIAELRAQQYRDQVEQLRLEEQAREAALKFKLACTGLGGAALLGLAAVAAPPAAVVAGAAAIGETAAATAAAGAAAIGVTAAATVVAGAAAIGGTAAATAAAGAAAIGGTAAATDAAGAAIAGSEGAGLCAAGDGAIAGQVISSAARFAM